MTELQALLLGIIQGLTEFLPVSSSGHLEIGHALLGIKDENNLLFVLTVHVATVLSTILVFRKDIALLCKDLFAFQWNDSTEYISKLLFSSIPIVIVGFLFRDKLEALFTGNLFFVGCMLLLTACLLTLTQFVKKSDGKITFGKALLIGLAQTLAVLPGISRSGSTIATGLLLKGKKEDVARFSFLMVLIPILGAAFLDIITGELKSTKVDLLPLLIGFVSAFISGWLACSWMIKIVKRGKLIYFAIYCALIGLIAIFAA
ncbi:Undecaprenyl-diphosphatase [Draconibacterium orientale]|jgi:undecaprenyl-diphosphatase|uniref:Undecaprenyl-diphosphatase n=1 Tax=Draconibacterium orientale TaxID=1168034 RepID=X5DFJ1_9BACT|nr:undecaprenyl-diphosphate phosphatase [Draconibacterium orientale]AHW59167.1 UDP-diphosphatase [Draconibacterium orientale]SEU02596.1 Undecaprenyl-diphosphatase [Draconibacterium orientale]